MDEFAELFDSEESLNAAQEWFYSTIVDPEDITLDELPSTFLWAPYLKHIVQSGTFFTKLLPRCDGVLLTGPAGNGKHTYADALTRSRMNYLLYDNTTGAIVCLISPDTLSPDLSIAQLASSIRSAYAFSSNILKMIHPNHSYVITFDSLDLYPTSISDLITECVSDYSGQRIFTVCIAEDESRIAQSLKRALIHCRCPKPNHQQRLEWLTSNMSFLVENIWDQPKDLPEKRLELQLEDSSLEELSSLTEGFSYTDLEDLLRMFKLYTVEQGARALDTTKPMIQVSIPKQDVLQFLALSRTPGNMQPVNVPMQAVDAYPTKLPIFNTDPPHSSSNRQSTVEEMVERMNQRDFKQQHILSK